MLIHPGRRRTPENRHRRFVAILKHQAVLDDREVDRRLVLRRRGRRIHVDALPQPVGTQPFSVLVARVHAEDDQMSIPGLPVRIVAADLSRWKWRVAASRREEKRRAIRAIDPDDGLVMPASARIGRTADTKAERICPVVGQRPELALHVRHEAHAVASRAVLAGGRRCQHCE